MGKTILIVDDTSVIREFLQEFFIDSGFDADIAQNGREGLELALSKDYSLDNPAKISQTACSDYNDGFPA